MHKLAAPLTFALVAGLSPTALSAQSAEPVPCENMLKELRAAVAAAKPSDGDAAKVKKLEDKGLERCNADDDKRADEFFGQAMKVVAK